MVVKCIERVKNLPPRLLVKAILRKSKITGEDIIKKLSKNSYLRLHYTVKVTSPRTYWNKQAESFQKIYTHRKF